MPPSTAAFDIEEPSKATAAGLRRVLPWWKVALMLSQYSSAGVLVLMPQFFGAFGYLGGPLWLAVWMICSTYVGLQLTPVVLQHPEITTFGELGFVLLGRIGRALFLFGQLGDLALYVAMALVYMRGNFVYGLAAAGASGVTSSCSTAWIVGIWAVLTIAVQFMRSFQHGTFVAVAFGAALVLIKLLVLIYDVGVERATYADRPPMQAFGPLANHTAPGDWLAFFSGTSTVLFANVSPFFQVEL